LAQNSEVFYNMFKQNGMIESLNVRALLFLVKLKNKRKLKK